VKKSKPSPIQTQLEIVKAKHPNEYQEWLRNCKEFNQIVKEIDRGSIHQNDLEQKRTSLKSSLKTFFNKYLSSY
jgi:hypothetical protein